MAEEEGHASKKLRTQLPVESPLRDHIAASGVKKASEILQVLGNEGFESFSELLEIKQPDMLEELERMQIPSLSRNRIKQYCLAYRPSQCDRHNSPGGGGGGQHPGAQGP